MHASSLGKMKSQASVFFFNIRDSQAACPPQEVGILMHQNLGHGCVLGREKAAPIVMSSLGIDKPVELVGILKALLR